MCRWIACVRDERFHRSQHRRTGLRARKGKSHLGLRSSTEAWDGTTYILDVSEGSVGLEYPLSRLRHHLGNCAWRVDTRFFGWDSRGVGKCRGAPAGDSGALAMAPD